MIDAFFCTNLVNYTIAMRGARAGVERPALMLYEAKRFEPRGQARCLHLPENIWTAGLLARLSRLGRVHTLYLPHDRLNKRFWIGARHAKRVKYLDDGLDTLRLVPRAFDPARQEPAGEFLTFDEYRVFPPWLTKRFTPRGACSLFALAETDSGGLLPLDGIDHVFVESPGLEPAALIEALGLIARRVLVVRHPVPKKRGPVPQTCQTVDGNSFNLEATLAAAVGKHIYLGETMVLVFAVYAGIANRNFVFSQLSAPQRANLIGLPLVSAGLSAVPSLFKLADDLDARLLCCDRADGHDRQ